MRTSRLAIAAAAIALLCAPAVPAQPAASAQKFEVATIKPCAPNDPAVGSALFGGSPGRLTINCTSLLGLINQAYVLYQNSRFNQPGGRLVPIENGPSWLNSERYSIEAKSDFPASQGEMKGPMLQAMLEDRFKLKMHTESREIPVYYLTVAKGGPKLQPAQPGSCIPFDIEQPLPPPTPGKPLILCTLGRTVNDQYELYGSTMADLAKALSGGLAREIIDQTGIQGKFDIKVPVSPSLSLLGAPAPPPPPPPGGGPAPPRPAPSAEPPDPTAPLASAQAIAQKLGLKLESGKGPGRFLVIDSVERPSAN